MSGFVEFLKKYYVPTILKKWWVAIFAIPDFFKTKIISLAENYFPTYQSQAEMVVDFTAPLLKWLVVFALIIFHVHALYYLWKKLKSVDEEESNPLSEPAIQEGLPLRQSEFASRIENLLGNHNTSSTFTVRYSNGFRNLNNQLIHAAASEYYAAFLQLEEIMLDRSTYTNGSPDRNLLGTFETRLSDLRDFSNEALNDEQQLRGIVGDLENTIGSLTAHIL